MSPYLRHWCASIAQLAHEVVARASGPRPLARMLRSGGSIGVAFVGFALFGSIEAAVLCALFTNLVVLVDQGGPLRPRLLVLVLAASSMAAAGVLGGMLAGSEPRIYIATFALALFAGILHGTLPGVEMVPRNALICLVVGAYLPVHSPFVAWAVLAGSLCAIGGAAIDHAIQGYASGPVLPDARPMITYPGPRFSAVYGIAAVVGLALGALLGTARPYWVTITTLVVMQPDRRASTLRALQRFIGTIGGVIIAFLIATLLPEPLRPSVFYGLGIAMPFIWPLAFARNYGLGVAIISTWILLLLDLALPADEVIGSLFAARLADTAAGCALALLGDLLVHETAPRKAELT